MDPPSPWNVPSDHLIGVWRWALPVAAAELALGMLICVSTRLDWAPIVPLVVAFLLLVASLFTSMFALYTVRVVDRREREAVGERWSVWSTSMTGAGRLLSFVPPVVYVLVALVVAVLILTPRSDDDLPSGQPASEVGVLYVVDGEERTEINRSTYDRLVAIEQAKLATFSSIALVASLSIGLTYRRYAARTSSIDNRPHA